MTHFYSAKAKLLKFCILASFICTIPTLFAQVPSYVPTNGLIGWWPFNGNANDESGNGNNGTVNGAALTADRNGHPNSAYNFNGSSSYISLSQPFFNGNSTVGEMSMSVWFRIYDYPVGNSYYLSTKEGFWRTIGLAIGPDGAIQFWGSQPSPQGYFNINSGSTLVDTLNWQLVTVTFNNGVLKLYLNSSLINSSQINYSTLNYSYL